jgi:hypothetical protein
VVYRLNSEKTAFADLFILKTQCLMNANSSGKLVFCVGRITLASQERREISATAISNA